MTEDHRFFSIVSEKTLQRNKIKIPENFVRKCGSNLRNEVFVKLPSGLEWKLGLTKSSDGKLWIDKGWSGFSKHCSLALWNLLVFQYHGNSQLHVFIFDRSTTLEINYPPINPNCRKRKGIEEQLVQEAKINGSVDHLKSSSVPCSKAKAKSPASCSGTKRSEKTSRVAGENRTQRYLKPKVKEETNDSRFEPRPRRNWRPLIVTGKARALEIANSFQSDNPFFTVVIFATYASGKSHFQLPIRFAHAHITTKISNASLRTLDGRSWSVLYRVRSSMQGYVTAKFCRGWKEFACENGLEEGDICTFELINRDDIVFKVNIVKVSHATHDTPGKFKVVKYEDNTSGEFCFENSHLQLDFLSSHIDKTSLSSTRPLLPKVYARKCKKGKELINVLKYEENTSGEFCFEDPHLQLDFLSTHIDKTALASARPPLHKVYAKRSIKGKELTNVEVASSPAELVTHSVTGREKIEWV